MWARVDNDRTHNAAVNFIYDIPAFRNNSNRLVKTALGGWQVSGIVTFESAFLSTIGMVNAKDPSPNWHQFAKQRDVPMPKPIGRIYVGT